MERTYAAYLGLVAFVASIADGWLHGGSTNGVLWHACFSLWAFVIVGFLAGLIAGWMVDEAIHARVNAEITARQQALAAKPDVKKA